MTMFIPIGVNKMGRVKWFFTRYNTFHMGKIIESYALQDIIGEGMYGKVYRAVHLRTKD